MKSSPRFCVSICPMGVSTTPLFIAIGVLWLAAACTGGGVTGVLEKDSGVADSEMPVSYRDGGVRLTDADLGPGTDQLSLADTEATPETLQAADLHDQASFEELDSQADDAISTPAPHFQMVAVGDKNACAVAGNTIWCWGGGLAPEAGAVHGGGALPMDATKIPIGFHPHHAVTQEGLKEIGVGTGQVCGLSELGQVTCWSAAWDESNGLVYSPLGLELPGGATDLSCSLDCCAAFDSGGVACWEVADESGEVMVEWTETANDIVTLSTGATTHHDPYHCYLDSGGKVHCWGSNPGGLLRVEDESPFITLPLEVSLDFPVEFLSAGKHYVCVATSAGAVACWGSWGGIKSDSVALEEGESLVALEAASNGWCALLSGGQAECRLVGESAGAAAHLSPLSSIAIHDHDGCLLDVQGAVACWGGNRFGQLGQTYSSCAGTMAELSVVSTLPQGIATGSLHTCIIDGIGLLDCWGWDAAKSAGAHWESLLPPGPGELWSAVDIAGDQGWCWETGDHVGLCAVADSGNLYCSPACPSDALGEWHLVDTDQPVVQIACGAMGPEAALDTSGNVWDLYGWSFVEPDFAGPMGISGMSHVTCGFGGCCASAPGAGVYCWGEMFPLGIPGDGSGQESLPDQGALDVAIGDSHACIPTPAGDVLCWGSNLDCAVGQPGDALVPAPELVALPAAATAIAAGYCHTCAALIDGRVFCWGRALSSSYDIYFGGPFEDCTPGLVAQFDAQVKFLVADEFHTIAVGQNGDLWFAGCNDWGVVPGGPAMGAAVPLVVELGPYQTD